MLSYWAGSKCLQHSCDVHCATYSIIFCEATAIYGVIIAIILQSKMNQPALRNASDEPINEVALYFAGYAVFGAGIAVGLTNIASGYVTYLRMRC